MFNNLIESSSHRSEFKRRGSFFLFTIASYALLFIIAGVVSIYAYDAQMEDQSLEIVTMMPLVDLPTPRPIVPDRDSGGPRQTSTQAFDERRAPMLSVNRPEIPPKEISTAPNPNLPVRDHVPTIISDRDFTATFPDSTGRGRDAGHMTGSSPIVPDIGTPPPPLQKPKPLTVSKGVITSDALSLPKPAYPEMAKVMRIQGKVSIQVLIDESGKVTSARAIDGHPVLRQPSEKAAYQARFSPTILGDQPVKVTGVITYNFLLQ